MNSTSLYTTPITSTQLQINNSYIPDITNINIDINALYLDVLLSQNEQANSISNRSNSHYRLQTRTEYLLIYGKRNI